MTYANRGMALEQIIELANKQYERKGLAVITKVPTPVKVLSNKGGRVIGFYEKKSTVDFVGVHKGKMIAFDAKETKGSSLPFNNIQQHQLDYMKSVNKNGGIAFIVVNFSEQKMCYRLSIEKLVKYMKNPYHTNKKSIPIRYFMNFATELKIGGKMVLDYLKEI